MYDDVEALANRYLDEFITRKIDRLDVAYTKFVSGARQEPVVETLLPLGSLEGADKSDQDGVGRVAVRVPAVGREHSGRKWFRPASG